MPTPPRLSRVIWRFTLLIVVSTVALRAAKDDRLVPEERPFGTLANTYDHNVRTYFAEAYQPDVVVRAIVLPSFRPECVVGIRKTAAGYSAFTIEATSMIYDFEAVRDYEAGNITSLDKDGKPIPLEKNKAYLDLKKKLPANFTEIKAEHLSRPIEPAVAQRIISLWKSMLREAKRPEESNLGCDGVSYHFSATTKDHEITEAQTWSPPEGSRCGALTNLSGHLPAFCNDACSLSELTKLISTAEGLIHPKKDTADEH